ncbi:MAG: aldehyde ferredoxin oxidoreductase family protein [Candidatus Hodarchaeales archaeon]|jgi:aldehyde:ferredoxin oxidoreductase
MIINGVWNKLLVIDLSKQLVETFSPGEDCYKQYIGGYGLGVRYLFENMTGGVDPLSPGNILGFFPGLLTGTGFPMTGRWMAVTKSPLTGLWNDSNCGGRCGPEMKQAGYDGIIFKGRAENPMFLSIVDDKIDFHDASLIWGKDTRETHEFIMKKYPKGKPLYIGPAGENLVRFASIMDDHHRTAGRGGSGAVMGSKNLKAVVFQGSNKVTIANQEVFKKLAKAYREFLKQVPSWFSRQTPRLLRRFIPIIRRRKIQATASQGTSGLILSTMKTYGTALGTHLLSQSGDAPVKNWSGIGYIDFPPIMSERISDDNVTKYNTKKYSCRNCFIGCGAKTSIKEGKWKDEKSNKPEYETLAAFGTLCLVDDVEFIFKINSLCDRMGLDTVSTGTVVAFAIESYLAGILDMSGLELDWGKPDPIYELVKMITTRTGVGDVLAEGVKRSSDKLGEISKPFAIHAHGMELPMHDPKFDPLFGVIYVGDATPGKHNQMVDTFSEQPEIKQYLKDRKEKKPRRYDYKGKGRYQALLSPYTQVVDAMGFCHFAILVGNNPPLVELLNVITGWNYTLESLFLTGKRIMTLRHLFNIREGAIPSDFTLPSRVIGDPPQEKGPLEGITIDVEVLKRGYYEALEWNEEGIPPDEILEILNLKGIWN